MLIHPVVRTSCTNYHRNVSYCIYVQYVHLCVIFTLCFQIEVDAYQDPDSNLPSSTDGSGLFGMMDWGRLHKRRPPKLPGHDVDEGGRTRPGTTTLCSEASAHLLKKLLEDVEVGNRHVHTHC